MRTEYGFKRTVSTAPEDIKNCRYMPGFLIPADVPRMAAQEGHKNAVLWGLQRLLASPGARVLWKGRETRIRTLVPARTQETGHCQWFKDSRCTIHAVAPFGCAFFDTQQGLAEVNARSQKSLMDILQAWQRCGDTTATPDAEVAVLYTGLWSLLWLRGRRAPGPDECRAEMAKEKEL
jgi:hypothetical protein